MQAPYSCIAVKELNSTHEPSFKSEVEMLKIFQEQPHPHLIRLLATFRYQGKYNLLFPYAESNLREFWKKNPSPEPTYDEAAWMLGQCSAIASGLHRVHEDRSTQDSMKMRLHWKQYRAQISKKQADDRRYGRHGDIKAENILVFDDKTRDKAANGRGSLVIADFGLTDFHRRATRSEVPAGHVSGSPSYEPPELMLRCKISRAYDIWSLACLYLEFITWLVCGWDRLKIFPQTRSLCITPNLLQDDTFFTILEGDQRTAVVRGSVRDWIADLHEQPRCSDFIHDFLNLISEEMLLVNPADRIRSSQLNWKLKCMLEQANKYPEYVTRYTPRKPAHQSPSTPSLAGFIASTEGNILNAGEDLTLPHKQNTSYGLYALRTLAMDVCKYLRMRLKAISN